MLQQLLAWSHYVSSIQQLL